MKSSSSSDKASGFLGQTLSKHDELDKDGTGQGQMIGKSRVEDALTKKKKAQRFTIAQDQ